MSGGGRGGGGGEDSKKEVGKGEGRERWERELSVHWLQLPFVITYVLLLLT